MNKTPRRLVTHVSNEAEFEAAIENGAHIVLQDDIELTPTDISILHGASKFTIDGVQGLFIDGANHTLGFASSSDSTNGRIFYIDNESEVEIVDLTLENGYLHGSSFSVYGGAIYLYGFSTLEMTRCTLSTNTIHSTTSVSQCRLLVLRVISCVILSLSLTHSLTHSLSRSFSRLIIALPPPSWGLLSTQPSFIHNSHTQSLVAMVVDNASRIAVGGE